MKMIRNSLMIGVLGALLLSGCSSSFKSQSLACVDGKAMKKETHQVQRETTIHVPSGLFDPYSSDQHQMGI
ncbi:hypothetical protein KVC60_01470 [Helicobacter pylori]|uniref:hypothetical protein n=1 Tax=Helicobacter pylori TaxID=210 RepID=UPI00165C5628|nr:hypothetical protein [Helicobacter pylori]WQS21008.1 hypothetical protein KVC60_01470 [Helicobacter pylori]WQS30349.1 hypothetical protein KVE56_01470 [Helicobacter pylori]